MPISLWALHALSAVWKRAPLEGERHKRALHSALRLHRHPLAQCPAGGEETGKGLDERCGEKHRVVLHREERRGEAEEARLGGLADCGGVVRQDERTELLREKSVRPAAQLREQICAGGLAVGAGRAFGAEHFADDARAAHDVRPVRALHHHARARGGDGGHGLELRTERIAR